MKINSEKVEDMELLQIDENTSAHCLPEDYGFRKMMVFYRHSTPVWAHKNCVIQNVKTKDTKKNVGKKNKRVQRLSKKEE